MEKNNTSHGDQRRRFIKTLSALSIGFTVSRTFGSIPFRGQPDKEGVYVITQPEHTPGQIAAAIKEIAPVEYVPSSERWLNLPRTAAALAQDGGELKIVMLGDSIINDTYRSAWYNLLQERYPRCKITTVAVVRGSTGCWWYKEKGRIKQYVLPLKPDLLIIGGISQKNDFKSMKKVIHQLRSAQPCDVLLVTNVFGPTDPNDNKKWSFDIPSKPGGYRRSMLELALEEKTGFFDMNAHWGRYIRKSGHPIDWYHRDEVHANIKGEQVIGHLLAAYLSPASSTI